MATKDFSGKYALITGASKGIGKATALELASDDASYMTGSDIIVDGGALVKNNY